MAEGINVKLKEWYKLKRGNVDVAEFIYVDEQGQEYVEKYELVDNRILGKEIGWEQKVRHNLIPRDEDYKKPSECEEEDEQDEISSEKPDEESVLGGKVDVCEHLTDVIPLKNPHSEPSVDVTEQIAKDLEADSLGGWIGEKL